MKTNNDNFPLWLRIMIFLLGCGWTGVGISMIIWHDDLQVRTPLGPPLPSPHFGYGLAIILIICGVGLVVVALLAIKEKYENNKIHNS